MALALVWAPRSAAQTGQRGCRSISGRLFGINAGAGASIGGSSGVNAGLGASVAGSSGVNAGVGASVGDGVEVGVGIGIGGTAGAPGTSGNPAEYGLAAVVANMSDSELQRTKKQYRQVLGDTGGFGRDLIALCLLVQTASR